ncbi:unnamed protein product [Sphacelaria rigidula]
MGLPLDCYSKENGNIRLTVNHQRLNAVIIVPRLPLPQIDESIDSLGRV